MGIFRSTAARKKPILFRMIPPVRLLFSDGRQISAQSPHFGRWRAQSPPTELSSLILKPINVLPLRWTFVKNTYYDVFFSVPYAEFNLQVQVKLEFVMTSVRTQGYYRETVGLGKNASFKITENMCGQKNLQTIRSYHAILSSDNKIFHSNIVVL